MLDEAFGPVEMAVEDDDPLEAFGDERVDDGPRTAARAEHDRLLRHLLPADEAVERDPEAGYVRVVADEPAAFAGDGVDRPRRRGFLGQAIDHRHDAFLVRDGDVSPQEVFATDLTDGLRELHWSAIPQLVARIDAELVESRLLHRARQRVGDRMADEDDASGHARTLSRSSKKPG